MCMLHIPILMILRQAQTEDRNSIHLGFPTDSPTFKISIRDYEDMAIKVCDKVTVGIKKADTSGIYKSIQ